MRLADFVFSGSLSTLRRAFPHTRQMSEYVRGFVWDSHLRPGIGSLLTQGQFAGAQLLAAIVLARTLGPTEFGIYSFAFAVVTLIQVMPTSGLDNVVIRYTAQYRATGSWKLLAGLWRLALIAAITYGLLSAGAVFGLFSVGWLPSTGALSPSALAAAAVPMIFLPMMTLVGAALRATRPGLLGQLPQFVLKPWIYITLLLVVVIVAPHALTAQTALYAQGAAALVAILAGGFWLNRYQPPQLRRIHPSYDPGPWRRSVLLFCVVGGLMMINTQADVLMLGLLGGAHETGLYKVAADAANVVALSLTAANLYIAPRIAAMYSRGENPALQRLLSLSARGSFAVALLVACALWLWGAYFLRLVFGAAYGEAYWPLAILCLAQLINVGAGSVGQVLAMTGHEADAARLAGLGAISNIALCAALIPAFGGVGAALSTSVTMLVWNGLMLVRVRQKTGLHVSIFAAQAGSRQGAS